MTKPDPDKTWDKSKIHWTKKRKIENIQRMIDDVEQGKVTILGRNPSELVAHLRRKIDRLSER